MKFEKGDKKVKLEDLIFIKDEKENQVTIITSGSNKFIAIIKLSELKEFVNENEKHKILWQYKPWEE